MKGEGIQYTDGNGQPMSSSPHHPLGRGKVCVAGKGGGRAKKLAHGTTDKPPAHSPMPLGKDRGRRVRVEEVDLQADGNEGGGGRGQTRGSRVRLSWSTMREPALLR